MHIGLGPFRTCLLVQAGARALFLASFAGLVAGCMSAHGPRLDTWAGAQNCHFSHVTAKAFESALRQVFDASRPNAYGLRPEEGGALVEQHWALDVVFAAADGVERWRIEYAPAGDGIDARADLEHVADARPSPGGHGGERSANVASYRQLWSRLAYALGRRAD